MDIHQKFMAVALSLAKRNVGIAAPNPSVGAIVVKEGVVIGRGVTASGGRPHAETIAISQAGSAAKGATLYVTLEPCSHHGKTPPCAAAVIKSGVKQVVVATLDPDERVNGNGIKLLKKSGIEVITGVLEKQAREVNAGFIFRVTKSRPFITIKIASSLDGRIALNNGKSQWITSDEARKFGHLLRSQHDGILVGVNTVLADDPELTCRIEGLENNSPKRFILDTKLQTPLNSKLVKSAGKIPTYILTAVEEKTKLGKYQSSKVNIIKVKTKNGKIDIKDALKKLAELGVNNLLVEGGAGVITSLLKEKFADRVIAIQAPKLLGADAKNAVGDLSLQTLDKAFNFAISKSFEIGGNQVSYLTPA